MKSSFIFMIALCLLIVRADEERNDIFDSSPTFSFNEAAVTLPSPASIKLHPGGRFDSRYKGNINYLHYQHGHYGEEMLEAFASRHYSPGKLLERMWDCEYAGKWLDAATRTAVHTGKQEHLAMVDAFAEALINYQQPNGYMGTKLPTDRELNDWEKSWDNWNQWNSMIGFLTHYEFRGISSSLDAATATGQWIIETFIPEKDDDRRFLKGKVTGGMTNAVIIGQLMRLYQYTENPALLEFVRRVIQNYPPIQQMLTTGDPFLFHPYMLCAVLNGMLRFAVVTEDNEMLARIEQVWDGLVESHMFPTGSLGESENLDVEALEDVPGGQLQETCATTEWIFLTQKLYSVTGRVKYIEALEKTCYNALLGAQSDDGMKWCYWTPLRYSKEWFHGPTRCCFWSGPRGIARLPQLIYATKGTAVYVNFYESSQAVLATDAGKVRISQNSRFPEKGASSVLLKTPEGWNGTLRVRIPGWAKNFKVKLNGKLVQKIDTAKGYSDVKIDGAREYQVEIKFDVPLILAQLAGEDYVICRGPEVLAIDIRDNIDTWLGQGDLISLPGKMEFHSIDENQWQQWPGPADLVSSRRRYLVKVHDRRTSELRGVILTPYADAGNEGAAFRTAFPLAENGDYRSEN